MEFSVCVYVHMYTYIRTLHKLLAVWIQIHQTTIAHLIIFSFSFSRSLSLSHSLRESPYNRRVGMKDYLRQLLVSEPVHGPREYPGGGNRGSRREDADAGRRGAGRNRPRPRRSTGGWSLRIRRRHQAAGDFRRAPRRRYRRWCWMPISLRSGELSRLRFLGADNENQCTLLGMQGLCCRGLAVVPPRLAGRGILHMHLLSVTPFCWPDRCVVCVRTASVLR